MKVLIVGLTGHNPHLKRLQDEGEKQGHTVDGCFVSDLVVLIDKKSFTVMLKNELDIITYDVIYLWTLGKRRWEWQIAAKYMSDKYGIVFVNRSFVEIHDLAYNPSMLTQLYKQKEADFPFPKTALIYNEKALDLVESQITAFPVIVKQADSSQGKAVYKVYDRIELEKTVKELSRTKGGILVREYIPNDGDIRVFTLGYKAVGAMKRTPAKGEFRSNISLGGSGLIYDLENDSEVITIAERVSKDLSIEIAGVDIILHKVTGKPYILEVNPGPQFLGLEKFTGINVAKTIIDYFETLIDGRHEKK